MLGVIGGTGLYAVESVLVDVVAHPVQQTPFGPTSSPIVVGKLRGDPSRSVAFIARHGPQHTFTPSEVPYAANIYALKRLGVRAVVSFSAVGSLKEEHRPGDFVLPMQLIDLTRGVRRNTFFGDGCVAHVSCADPVSCTLADDIRAAAETLAGTDAAPQALKVGGTYVCIEGPAFSTRAESNLYRTWGADLVGMTMATEAKLAREAELAYATVAMVTDYDCWRQDEEAVSADAVGLVMQSNSKHALALLEAVVRRVDAHKDYPEHNAMKGAIMGTRSTIPDATYAKLELIISKYIH